MNKNKHLRHMLLYKIWILSATLGGRFSSIRPTRRTLLRRITTFSIPKTLWAEFPPQRRGNRLQNWFQSKTVEFSKPGFKKLPERWQHNRLNVIKYFLGKYKFHIRKKSQEFIGQPNTKL